MNIETKIASISLKFKIYYYVFGINRILKINFN